MYTVADEDGALISLTGWLTPAGIYSVDTAGRVLDTGITPKPAIDVSAYETKRFFAAAKDGTKIPYTLIYRKGLKLDGGAPTWISAYGSYGLAAYTPAFAGRTLALVDAGAIVGYANVRGGGEYGREWHKAGQLANKPNTWRDLIAVCEDLIAKKYTSPAASGDRRPLRRRHHGRARPDRTARPVRRRRRRSRLVEPPALRGRAERLRRRTRMGRHQ